jgi:hypothetical protein
MSPSGNIYFIFTDNFRQPRCGNPSSGHSVVLHFLPFVKNGVKSDVALLTEGFRCGCSKAVSCGKYFDPPNMLFKFKSGGCYAVSEGFLSAGEYYVIVASLLAPRQERCPSAQEVYPVTSVTCYDFLPDEAI